MTILSLAPAILILTTAFTRIVVVLHFLRQAMGTQQVPPATGMIGLCPLSHVLCDEPDVDAGAIPTRCSPIWITRSRLTQAYDKGVVPMREFMMKQTREEDLALFVKMTNGEKPASRADVPLQALIPAFAHQRAACRLSDRVCAVYPVPGDRYGDFKHSSVDGDDDVASGAHFTAVQDPPVRSGGRLASGGEFAP